MSRRHLAFLAVGVVAVSFSSVLIRLADAPPLTVAFWRMAIASAILLPPMLVRRGEEIRAFERSQWATAGLAGLLLAAHFATWVPSLSYISVGASTVLVTTQPVWVAVIGRILGARIARATVLGIALSLVGAIVIFGRDLGTPDLRGDALALLGAVAAAGYFLSGRSLRRRVSLLAYVGVAYTTCAAVLSLVVVFSGEPFLGLGARAWLLFLLMALGPQILGHTVFNYLLSDVEPGIIAIAVTAEPVGATLLAFAFLGEVPPWTAFLGGALILAGIWLTIRTAASRVGPEVPAMSVG
jgi:drug/metabolite transporter (DMT)-like permease